jgi:CIC family chloride channel protein
MVEPERASDAPPPSMWLDPLAPRAALKNVAVLLVVASATAGFAILFRAAASFVYRHAFGADDVVDAFHLLPHWLRFVTVAAGGAIAGLVVLAASRHKGGQGVGGVMEAVALGTGRISLRASLWKALGCWAAIVTGSSVGREGPIIQIGGAIGGLLGTRAKLSLDRTRVLIAGGTAAGFAAAYNTPFAAVLFVLEIVSGVVTIDLVLATTIATAAATAITRLAIGGGPIYGARSFSIASNAELFVFVVLGAAAGLVGAGFSAMLAQSEHLFARLPTRQPITAAVGGILVGLVAMALPEVTGNGYEAINRILDGSLGAKVVLVLLLAKAFATSTSVGSGTPGGAFTPSLFIGAALGGTTGHLLHMLAPERANAPGAYALVGMAALCAATTHAPLMSAVLVFELSGDYSIVLPLLFATATATIVARRVRPTSVYTDELRRRGLEWNMTFSGRDVRGRE